MLDLSTFGANLNLNTYPKNTNVNIKKVFQIFKKEFSLEPIWLCSLNTDKKAELKRD